MFQDKSVLLRFSDLKARNIVRNYVTLGRWIASQDFPSGFLLGPNTRVWRESDVEAWLQSRPTENLNQRGFAKRVSNGGAIIKPPPENENPPPLLSAGNGGRVSNNPVVTPGYSEANDSAQAGEPLPRGGLA